MRQHTGLYGHLTGAGRGLLLPLLALVFMGVTGWVAASSLPWPAIMAEDPAVPVIEMRSLLALVDHHGEKLAPAALEKPATLVFFGYLIVFVFVVIPGGSFGRGFDFFRWEFFGVVRNKKTGGPGQGGAPGATGVMQALSMHRMLHAGRSGWRRGVIDAHGGLCTLSVVHVLELP